ncbi:hypothetical protein SAMN02745220_04986 [Desulfopila aestuarii DSM 18488]|uniref:Uncharacterized protein n=1 Tax=Desulfopila aestuarii DSM 18488 TaxID=1121416 RepID=A0A1M7YKT7_9BACT|nr:hypothetical protein SAMN02745220_04986 [Desulfopila aestuarii DSM 18488]
MMQMFDISHFGDLYTFYSEHEPYTLSFSWNILTMKIMVIHSFQFDLTANRILQADMPLTLSSGAQ